MPNIHPEPVNFTGLQDIFTYVNILGEGWTMAIYLSVMYLIFMSFMVRKGSPILKAFVVSSYIIAIVVGFMFPLGMVSANVTLLFSVVCGLSILIYLIGQK